MDTRTKLLQMLKNEPVKFGHWVGFRDLTDLHNGWLKSFLYSREDQTLLAHRGSYKTTTLSIGIALMVDLFPSLKILFFRKTDPDVSEVMAQVGKILQTGANRRIVRDIYGVELQLLKNTSGIIDTNLSTANRGQPQVMGLGIGTSITGKHADIVITDDIVNLSDRLSASERNATKTRYMELQNVKNRGGRFINTGTKWHKDDAISIMPNITAYDCYSTGLLTTEQIHELQQKMTPSLFACNYELKIIADKEALFSAPNYTDDTEAVYDGIAHIDASYGGGDSTALTIIRQTDGFFYVYGKRFEGHVNDHLETILALVDHYRAGTIWCERNADKGYLAERLEEMGAMVQTYHETTNKYIKISSHLKSNWDRIRFIEETDPEYIQQILDYTEHAAHDDCPDSLASAIRQLDDGFEIQLLPGGII